MSEILFQRSRIGSSFTKGHPTFQGNDLTSDSARAFATLGLIAGIPAKRASEALDHLTIEITLDLYSHVLPSMEEDRMLAIDNLLKREV